MKRGHVSQRRTVAIAMAVVAGLCMSGGAALTGGKTPPDVPVTSMLQVTGAVTPDPGTNYRIEGDGLGSYSNGVSSVSSILQGSSGDWVLDTTSSQTRLVLIDLRDPVPNSGAQQIFAYEELPVRIIVKCSKALAGSFPAMTLNQTLSCPTGVAFNYKGVQYGLMMSSGPNSENYAETNNPQVTCTAVNSATNQCVAWTITPITQAWGTVENVARLRQPLKCAGCYADLGDFFVTFAFGVTNP